MPKSRLERMAKDPKWRAKWAERNRLLDDYLTRRSKGAINPDNEWYEELEVGDRDYDDVEKAFKRLKKDEKNSIYDEFNFQDEVLGILHPERPAYR
jgi:hypothetical protein